MADGRPAPDLLLIALDDIPLNMLGAYGAVHGLAPHLDGLAREGVAYERVYTTSPLCTPSRFSLLTGLYAANASSIPSHRPWNLVGARVCLPWWLPLQPRPVCVAAAGFNTFLTGAEPTLAHALQRRGYRTGFVGKYHLGFPLNASKRRGRASFGGSGHGLSYAELTAAVKQYGGFDEAPAVWGGNKQIGKQTAQTTHHQTAQTTHHPEQTTTHHPEWMAREAAAFISRAVMEGRRYLLYFAPTLPHAPFALPGALLASANTTPAGIVSGPLPREWERSRRALLSRLTSLGLICRDYTECRGHTYPGAQGRVSAAYRAPVALREPWLDPLWLEAEGNFEQARLLSPHLGEATRAHGHAELSSAGLFRRNNCFYSMLSRRGWRASSLWASPGSTARWERP